MGSVCGTITVGDVCAADRVGWSFVRHFASGLAWPIGTHTDAYTYRTMGQLQSKSGGLLYDLPTSAEWEFAARAGTTSALPSGKSMSDSNFAEIGRGVRINCKHATEEPGSPQDEDTKAGYPTRNCSLEFGVGLVGQYRPNAFGLYDVMGNVQELCLDYYNPSEFPFGGTDPKGPLTPDNTSNSGRRVVRGGSYQNQANDVGTIFPAWADYQTKDIGYRICLHEVNK